MSASALEFLFSLERFGMKFGLASMARLCERLHHPEAAFRSVLVGGTNGKGSVTAMVETALRAAGCRVARYTSPHLVRLEERFVIDGREIDTASLEAAAGRVQRAAEDLVASHVLEAPPTFFECATAIAFELFRDAGVELAILEVGLGGRLDATNIVEPIAAAIVSIDFDHQAQLGTTLASIAYEKAGIVRRGISLVCGALPDDARRTIEEICASAGARLVRADLDVVVDVKDTMEGALVTFTTPRLAVSDVRLALQGGHQILNAAVTLRLLDVLDGLGVHTDEASARAGLAQAKWPGRLERFTVNGCTVLIDAAHNPAGARALAAYIRETFPNGVTLVFGAMRDKAVAEMLEPLSGVARQIICTTASTPRAIEARAIAHAATSMHPHVEVERDPLSAVARACGSGRPVVVAGSIFLIGPVRERLAHGILP